MALSCFTDLIKYLIRFNQNSSFPINELPLEILLEIFYKVPVKQLHRNKIVCKLWSSLISNPAFPSAFSSHAISPNVSLLLTCHNQCDCIHTKHLTNDGKSWFQEKDDPFKFLPGGDQPGNDKVECIGSSNGLVLCSRTNYLCCCFYYVCNPMMKQWITLPSPPSCTCTVLSGFVCNPSSEIIPNSEIQFKVVRLFVNPIYSMDLTLEIFDSATNQWKVLKMQSSVSVFFIDKVNAIEHRGILHWECRRRNLMVVFEPNDEQCYMFPLPGSVNDNVYYKLDVSQNDLIYIEIDFRFGSNNISTIWRCDQLEGKRNWVVHRKFVLNDWAFEESVWGLKLQFDHIDLRKRIEHGTVLGIDPVDCNMLYLSLCSLCGGSNTYSLNIGRKMIKGISSTEYVKSCMMVVQPSWPAILPNLPPLSPDDNLYKDTHTPYVCFGCRR